MNRIVCVGNRFAGSDSVGPRVHDRLAAGALPSDVELVDGGLAGIDLLGQAEGIERLVFVDSVSGFAAEGSVVVLDGHQASARSSRVFDHSAGLPFLLRMIPLACDSPAREVFVVGVEGEASEDAIEEAARRSVELAGGTQVVPEARGCGATP